MTGSLQTWTLARAKVPRYCNTLSHALYRQRRELSVASLFPSQVRTVQTQPVPGSACSSTTGLLEAVPLQSFKVPRDWPAVTATSIVFLHYMQKWLTVCWTVALSESVEHGSGKRGSPGIDTKHRHQSQSFYVMLCKDLNHSSTPSSILQKPTRFSCFWC